jgi:hypothetical protein
MQEATAKRIFETLKKENGGWLTTSALAIKSKSHYYAILVYLAQNRNKLERVAYGAHVFVRLKA